MINKIKDAYITYIKSGYSSRSQIAANVMHDAIKDAIQELITPEDGLIIRTASQGGEFLFSSEIHDKRIDITVVESATENPVLAVSFKMPIMSVNKNMKNYFEMNIGDATLVKQNGTPFYYFMVLDNNSLKVTNSKVESDLISNTSISSFSKVMKANYYAAYRPNHTFITKVDFGDRDYKNQFINGPFSRYKDGKDEHIQAIKEFTPIGYIYNSDGSWTRDFDKKLSMLLQSIKLDIELYKIRRNQ